MLNKLYRFFTPRKEETIFSYTFRSTQASNQIYALILSLLIPFFCANLKTNLLVPFVCFLSQFSFSLVIISVAEKLIVSTVSLEFQKYQIDETLFTQEDKAKLIKQILSLPKKIGLLTYISFLAGGITATVILNNISNLPLVYFSLMWIFISVFPAISLLKIVQEICSQKSESIVSKHFQRERLTDYLNGKHYAGLSLGIMFAINVFLPFLATILTVLVYTFFNYNDLSHRVIVKIIFAFIIEFGLSVLPAMIFILRLKNTNFNLQKLFKLFESKRDGESFHIPINYFSDFSFTADTLNKKTRQYAEEYIRHKNLQEIIISSCEKLMSEIDQLGKIIDNQGTLIQDIKQKISESENLTVSIDDHVSENRRIAVQTTEHVNFGLSAVKENISKINEITKSNESSVSGIKTLSNEINSIWEIVNIINGIADRTKIIAFNAELEAEAFEAENTSFKNVAVNIRALADKIMELTKEIRSQIQTIQNAGFELINSGEDFTSNVKEGNKLATSLESLYKTMQITAQESVYSTEAIKKALNSQSFEREKILSQINRAENILSQVRIEANGVKSAIEKISEQTKIKKL